MSNLAFAFDTLAYVKRLKEADVPEKQAEAQALALRVVLTDYAAIQVDATTRAVSEAEAKMDKSVLRIEHRMDNLENRFQSLESRFESLENRFESLENKFENLKSRFQSLESKFENLKNRFESLENKFENLKSRFESLESKFESLKSRFENLENKLDVKIALVRKEIVIARRDTIIWLGGMLIVGFGTMISIMLKVAA